MYFSPDRLNGLLFNKRKLKKLDFISSKYFHLSVSFFANVDLALWCEEKSGQKQIHPIWIFNHILFSPRSFKWFSTWKRSVIHQIHFIYILAVYTFFILKFPSSSMVWSRWQSYIRFIQSAFSNRFNTCIFIQLVLSIKVITVKLHIHLIYISSDIASISYTSIWLLIWNHNQIHFNCISSRTSLSISFFFLKCWSNYVVWRIGRWDIRLIQSAFSTVCVFSQYF